MMLGVLNEINGKNAVKYTSYVASCVLRVTPNGQMVMMGYFVDVIRESVTKGLPHTY